MSGKGLWEQVYLRTLEIDRIEGADLASIAALVAQLSTLEEMIPASPDPADNFEVYVLSRVSRAVNGVLSSFVARQGGQR